MKRIAREFGFALLAWLVPFAVSVCIFPLKESHAPLFDSLMGVVLASSTIVLGCIYLRRISGNYVAGGIKIGACWVIANWVLDGLMFSSGPMKMSFSQYVMDIGTAYLMIPVITIGLGTTAQAGLARKQSTESGL